MIDPPRPAAADGPVADPAAFVRRDGEGLCHLDLMAENIHCADCIRKIERGLLALPGVAAARVNLSLRRIAITWREGMVAPVALVEGGHPAGISRRALRSRHPRRDDQGGGSRASALPRRRRLRRRQYHAALRRGLGGQCRRYGCGDP
jgi:cation transport ATPase